MPRMMWSADLGGIPGVAVKTWTAVTDPSASNDATTGIEVGDLWFNATANRLWVCHQNTAGAAQWVFDGADYTNGGSNPPGEVTQFGSGTGVFGEEGNINRQINAGVTPAGTGSDYVVGVYSLPPNSFDVQGRGINILGQGTTGGTGTNTKRAKVIIGATTPTVGQVVSGGTTIADTGVINTSTGSGGWQLEVNVFKYGAAASNTQKAYHAAGQSGGTVATLVAPTALTLTESGAIPIAVTINNGTTAGDMTFDFLEINAMN